MTVLESLPQTPRESDTAGQAPPPAPEADDEPAAPSAADAGAEPAAPSSGQVLAACLAPGGGGCLVLNIAVTDLGADRCIELTVDNCGTYSRAGIPVNTPVTWRLGSGSVGPLEGECLPAAYDPDSAVIINGSGSIRWNLETRRPSDVVVDVSLDAASTARVDSPVAVTGTFAGAVPDCGG